MSVAVAVVAALGWAVGAMLPRLVARIPDRQAHSAQPPRTSYRELAAAPWLGRSLAAVTALVWGLLAWSRGLGADLPAFLAVAALGMAAAYVDVREHRLPDWLTYPAAGAAVLLLAAAALGSGSWASYGRAWLGAAAFVAFLLVLALARPGELGLGDVKLAGSLGLLLGWLGWAYLTLGAFLGFLFAGLLSVVLLAARRAGRRTPIPLGPFLLAGALVAAVWGEPLLDAYLGR